MAASRADETRTGPGSPATAEAGGPLLARRARLAVPQPLADHVARPRLVARLDDAASAPLTLVVAGAGYGKTTMLSEWTRSTRRRVAWLSLDPSDADPRQFASALVAALRQAWPGAAPSMDDLIGGSRELSASAVAEVLADDLLDLPGEVALVLDDLHAVPGAGPAEVVAALLGRPLPTLRIVASSRRRPSALDDAALRKLAPVPCIGAEELAFTEAEIAAFVAAAGRPNAGGIAGRTDGWPAGVRALSLAGDAAARAPEGVRAYLELDVLSGQPTDLVDLLRDVSVVERVGPDLAAALSGTPQSAEACAALLEDAARRGLFVARLAGPDPWWRVHPLLRDVLREDLRAHGILGDRHAAASAWYAASGLVDEAVEQAFLAGDADRAADLLAGHVVMWLEAGRDTAYDWLDRLPPETVAARPALLVARAALMVSRGNVEAARLAVADADRGIDRTTETGRLLAWELFVVRHYAGNQASDASIALDDRWLEAIRDGVASRNRLAALPVTWGLAMARADRTAEALALMEPLAEAELPRGDALSWQIVLTVAGIHFRAADLPGSDRWLDLLRRRPGDRPGEQAVSWLALLQAASALERGDLAAAEALARLGLDLSPGRFFVAKAQLAPIAARAMLADGRLDEARAIAVQNRRRAHLAGAFSLLRHVEGLDAEILLAAGDVAAAAAWADGAPTDPLPDALLAADQPIIPQAHAWLARGGPGDAARAVAALTGLRTYQEGSRNLFSLGRALPLLAVAHAAAGDREAALAALRDALDLAPPTMIRRFADSGPAVLPLLADLAGADDALAPRAAAVLAALAGAAPLSAAMDIGLNMPMPMPMPMPVAPAPRSAAATDDDLPEDASCPLSRREREVLALMATWMTNKEIAAALGIRALTVRDHVTSILRKLDATDRREAVAAARRAGWLDPA